MLISTQVDINWQFNWFLQNRNCKIIDWRLRSRHIVRMHFYLLNSVSFLVFIDQISIHSWIKWKLLKFLTYIIHQIVSSSKHYSRRNQEASSRIVLSRPTLISLTPSQQAYTIEGVSFVLLVHPSVIHPEKHGLLNAHPAFLLKFMNLCFFLHISMQILSTKSWEI